MNVDEQHDRFPWHPQRASEWLLRTQRLQLTDRPLLMGIVNVTPDSFSDGGAYLESNQAVDHALQLVEDGADIIDIGGESTRPYASTVATEDELQRIMPVVTRVRQSTTVPISIDTSKSTVARLAVQAGAEIINDVSGLEGDPEMLRVAVETDAGVCAMHMQGCPRTMQDNPSYTDVTAEIFEYLAERRDALTRAGVDLRRVCLDPGIGFGKTHGHNIQLMRNCWRFHELGCPLLVGHSRKGFVGKLIGDSSADRTLGTAGAALALFLQGVQIIRVHDVRAVRQAMVAFAACGGSADDAAMIP